METQNLLRKISCVNQLSNLLRTMNDIENHHYCCFCGKEYAGIGYDAEPVWYGRCCDQCNTMLVLPARIYQLQNNY